MKTIVRVLVIALVLLFIAGLTTRMGLWPTRATSMPPSWENSIAKTALHASLRRQSAGLTNPLKPSNDALLAGLKIFRNNCAGCHGDHAHPSQWGTRNFYPRVPQFAEHQSQLSSAEMFVAIKYGVRYSGMGGWDGLMSDDEIWTVATFLEHLNSLPPEVSEAWSRDQ